jgi:hypothetical protein
MPNPLPKPTKKPDNKGVIGLFYPLASPQGLPGADQPGRFIWQLVGVLDT